MKRTSPPKAASNVEVAIREQQACDTKRAPLDVTCVASGKDVRIYHFQTDPFCWYVIEESGRLAVVDAGFPGHYRFSAAASHSLDSASRMLRASC